MNNLTPIPVVIERVRLWLEGRIQLNEHEIVSLIIKGVSFENYILEFLFEYHHKFGLAVLEGPESFESYCKKLELKIAEVLSNESNEYI